MGCSSKKNSQDTATERDVNPREGGRAWFVVVGMAVTHAVWGIIVRTFGVTYIELLDKYNGSATATAWVGGINLLVSGLCAPLASRLCLRFSCRAVTMVGGLFVFVGFVVTSLAPNIITVYVSFGLVVGFGISLTHTPGFILVVEHFEKRRALALSLGSLAAGLGAVFPPAMLYLFEEYGYNGAFLIIGAICSNACLAGSLYSLVPQSKKASHVDKLAEQDDFSEQPTKTIEDFETKVSEPKSGCCPPKNGACKRICDCSLVSNPRFVSLAFANVCYTFNMGLVGACIPILAMEFGLTKAQGVSLVTVSGVSTTIVTLALGFIMDLKRLRSNRTLLYTLFMFLSGLASVFNPHIRTYVGMIALVFFRTGCFGFLMSQRATVVADMVAKDRFPHAFGVILMTTTFGQTLGRLIGGIVKDITGYYHPAFYVVGAMNLLGSTGFFLTELNYIYAERKTSCSDAQGSVTL